MPLVRRLHSRGANITVVAAGEVLFTPAGPIPGWTRRFSNAVTRGVSSAAPTNSRPRWAHYGAPLKKTITSSSRIDPVRMKAYVAVGSRANYSAYVDQGTGIYGGGGAYEAKILPPWTRGSPSLYEHTWHPPYRGDGGAGHRNPKSVEIKGQKGQYFFDRGLNRGFAAMHMASVEIPGNAFANDLRDFPEALLNGVLGNTPADAAFRAQLEEWRKWRDTAYNAGRALGKGASRFDYNPKERRKMAARQARARAKRDRRYADRDDRAQRQKANAAERSRRYRKNQSARNQTVNQARKKDEQARKQSAAQNLARFKAAMLKKYGSIEGSIEQRGGYFYATVPYKDDRGRRAFKVVRGKVDR